MLEFLEGKGVNLSHVDREGQSLVTYAAKFGDLEVLEYLSRQGLDFNLVDKYSQNPVFYAARHGHLDSV